jgi:hypothetical protein
MIKSHGVDVIINDSLVGNCMKMAVLVISLICTAIALIGGKLFIESVNVISLLCGLSFLATFSIVSVATCLIESGASATLVCYAEDPATLQRTKPELYREITSSYQRSFL